MEVENKKNRRDLNNRFIEVFAILSQNGEIISNSREKSKSAFAEKLNTKGHIIDLYLRGERFITFEQAKKLCELYNISERYMLLGQGEPFDKLPLMPHSTTLDVQEQRKSNILFSNMKAFASAAMDVRIYEETETFFIPGIEGEHVAFYIKGNSMQPTIYDSDMVICKKIDNMNSLVDNDIYAVVTDGAVMVKRVQKIFNRKKQLSQLKLISDNYLDFDPFSVELSNITHIFKVVRKVTGIY